MIIATLFLIAGIQLSIWIGFSPLMPLMPRVICSVVFLTFILFKYCAYLFYRVGLTYIDDRIKMKWKMIKDLYLVNPDKWDYKYKYSCYSMENRWYCYLFYKKDSRNDIAIILSFIDYQRLRFYYFLNKYKESNENKNELLKTILESAQQDIDRKREEAIKQINRARDITNQVQKRLTAPSVEKAVQKYFANSGTNEMPKTIAVKIMTKYNCSGSEIVNAIHKYGGKLQ